MINRAMKKNYSILVIVILILSSAHLSFAGGGWPQKKGSGFFKLGQYILVSGNQFSPNGTKTKLTPRVGVYSTSLYGEYGITDRLTGIIYLPFFARSVQNNLERRNGNIDEGSAINSIGDTDISLKYGLIPKGPVVLSATLTLGLPLGNPSGGNSGALSTGDGEFNQLITLEASHSFYPIPLYATVSGGLNNRGRGFSEEWRVGVEVGYTAGNFTFLGRLRSVQSFMNGDESATGLSQGVFGDRIEYVTVSPEIIYDLNKKIGVSFGVSKALSGSVVLADLAYDFGISMKL